MSAEHVTVADLAEVEQLMLAQQERIAAEVAATAPAPPPDVATQLRRLLPPASA